MLADYCLQHKPENIVECSSGLSTLILARCCQLNAKGKVISLENGPEFAEQTRNQLKQFKLDDYASVQHTPLINISLDDQTFSWYDLDKINIDSIDLLVIDGPPGFMQSQSRYPALPLLSRFFSDQVRIFLDDAARDDEQLIVERWLDTYPIFEHQYHDTERGCSILKKK